MAYGAKRSREEIEKIVANLGHVLLNEYMKGKRRIILIENFDGYKWEGVFDTFINPKKGIGFFEKSNNFVLKNISLWLKLNRSEFYLCEENKYQGNNKNLKIFHNIPECQEEFLISWNRISRGAGCSVCEGHQIGKYNSLAYRRPDLESEWHPDNTLKPSGVTCGSSERVYWICSKCGYGENKEWITAIQHRANGKGCPSCWGTVVSDRNRLSINFSKIADEWDYSKNKDTPYNVSYGSEKMRWWICPKGHSYCSQIKGRANGSGCKKCADEQRESKIATELKKWCKETFKYVDTEHKMLKNPKSNHWLWCDIYIGKSNTINGIYIEIHGAQHYFFVPLYHKTKEGFKESQNRDKIKKRYAKKSGTYIEIDLRKIKTIEQAIECVKFQIPQTLDF